MQRQMGYGMEMEKPIDLHPSSLCFSEDAYQWPWLCYSTLQHTKKLYAHDVTEAMPYALLLFGQEPFFDERTRTVRVGNLVRFSCVSRRVMGLLQAARGAFQKELQWKLENPAYDHTKSRGLAACVKLLSTHGLGCEVEGMVTAVPPFAPSSE